MKWLLLVLLSPFLLALAALVLNRVPWLDPPGPAARLKLYLTTNVAETRVDHVRPELRPLELALPEPQMRDAVIAVIERLGWRDLDEENGVLSAVVVTPLLRFKDDVGVRIEPQTEGLVRVQVRSASRVGQGDLGANTRHVMDLFAQLRRVAGGP
jgi:uncharacterized protein (DUF1499 family)